MERLTKWNDKTEGAELISWNEEEWKDFMGSLDVPICTELSIAIDKLAEYEDIEEKITKKFAGCIDIKTILDSFCAFYDMQETKEELAQCTLLTNEDVLKYRQWKDAEEQGVPPVETPTWIPCSEKMPSEHDYPEQKHRVLASCSDGIVRNASIKSMLNGEKKYALGHIEFTYEAWMPLPEPYKGE